MNVELLRVLVEEHVERLRADAQAPPGRLAGFLRGLLGRRPEPAEPAALTRNDDQRRPEKLAA